MNILSAIAFLVFFISSVFFFGGFSGRRDAASRKKCTEKGTATLVYTSKSTASNPDELYTIEYTVDGVRLTVPVTDGGVKGIDIRTPLGTEVPIWYDPQNPGHVIISEEPFVNVTADSWKRTQKRALKWMLVSLALSILFFFLSVK